MAAPTLKSKYYVSIDVTTLKVTDLTGAYSAASNPGGWGAPNWLLSQTAIMAIVKRKASAGDQYFVPSNLEVTFNPSAISTTVTEINFTYLNDGVFEITLAAIPASTDGINLLSGGAIPEGQVFYWAHTGSYVWKKVGGINTAITDLHTLLADISVLQILATDILEPKLAVQKQKMYKEYRIARDTECDDADDKFTELQKLSQDIQGSIYAFYSGLTTEAQSQVETMLNLYELA